MENPGFVLLLKTDIALFICTDALVDHINIISSDKAYLILSRLALVDVSGHAVS